MKYLISNGGSMTVQPENKGIPTTTPYEVARHLYPDIEHINLSRVSSGNHRAAITTQNYFHENPDKIGQSIVIVGWISQYVTDFIGNKKSDWNRDQIFSKQFEKYAASIKGVNESTHEMNYFHDILTLQTYLEHNNIPYFFYSAHDYPFQSNHPVVNSLREQINTDRFYNFMSESQHHWLQENELSVSQDPIQQNWLKENLPSHHGQFDPHASKKGCEIFGRMMYDHIKEKGIEL